ncbi:MAG: hypothetical protein N2323_04155 [candidate division WOR-3 bacterium]|nr:hypothetical protein [candidate division WOR-3 bacterium]MCX7837135.1 hypothetical protein [candidate division WOR-3 bacterium]MDW8113656.1 hypothetical protein [candidate division WOR-3 bacterium]
MKKLLFFVIFFFFCLEKPKLPEWDTEITIPLLEKKVTLFSLLDTHYFIFNSDSTLNFFYKTDFDTILPITKINFNIDRFDSVYYLNNFKVCDTFFSEIIINVEEILGILFPDSFIILPPARYSRDLEKLISIDDFHYGFIEEALLILKIENPSPINFKYFKVNLGNVDFDLGNVEPNSQKEHYGAINNIFISSPINILLTYEIFTEESLFVRKNDYLKLILKFINVKLREGKLKFKKTFLNNTCNYYINFSDFDLYYGEIKEGYLELNFVNRFSFPLLIFLKIEEIDYEDSFNIFAYSYKKISLPLREKIIRQNFPDNKGFLLLIEINAQISDSQNFFSVNRQDYFSFNGQIRDLKFKKIEGNFLSPLYFLNNQDSLIINFLGNPKGIKFEKGEIFLEIISNVKAPITIFLNGKSINRNGEICSLHREINLPLRNGEPLIRVNERIDATNLINNGPKILKFNYSGRINGQGKIEEKDFFLLNASFELPLKFSFSKDTFIAYEKEIFLSKEKGEEINKNLVGGELIIEAVNHFPIGFDGSLVIKSEEDSIILPFSLVSGVVSEKGCCEKEKRSEIILEIKENQLEIFKKEKLKTQLKINLPESDTVFLRSKDFLSFKSYAILKVKTKEIVRSIKR